MASRYTDIKMFSYCVSPLTIWQNGERRVVPCGRCNGCLLHKANAWSMRLRNEIDYSLVSVWFTLTYNNKYIPTLFYDDDKLCYVSNHSHNIRFDGVCDVLRNDDIVISSSFPFKRFRPQNFPLDGHYIGYSSKRDFQLFLKLLRKDVSKQFPEEIRPIRYFAISEYGPTFFRPHIHGLLFFQSWQVAEYCREHAIYKAWQMCDKTLFDGHTSFADSGVSGYLTNYVTGFSDLPKFFTDRQIKPFRLSSKGKALGSNSFDKKEFFEKIVEGDLFYVKRVERLGVQSICQYPKNYISSVFPKCFQFSRLSFERLHELYGFLFTNERRRKIPLMALLRRLHSFVHPSDSQAILACYKTCGDLDGYGYISPFHYCFLLDLLYYRLAMSSLRYQYEWQVGLSSPLQIFCLYDNLVELCLEFISKPEETNSLTLAYFLEGFGFALSDVTSQFVLSIRKIRENGKETYIKELEFIKDECVKVPKINEFFGTAPHIV